MLNDSADYSKLTYKNKNILRKFSHKIRFNKALNILRSCNKNDINFLDFGCGDGYFLKLINDEKLNLKLNAFDPDKQMITQMMNLFHKENIDKVNIFNDIKKIKSKYDIITCLETLEHFNENNQIKLLKQIKYLLKDDGFIVISVPLEIYLSGFLKGLVRILSFQKNNTTSLINLFKVLFNFKIKRNHSSEYIESHVGFDHNKLIELINMDFSIEKKFFSPFPIFSSFLNSQMFIICKKKYI